MLHLPGLLVNIHFHTLKRNKQFFLITQDWELSFSLLQLHLILYYDWTRVPTADSILQLTQVWGAEYELRLILSYS